VLRRGVWLFEQIQQRCTLAFDLFSGGVTDIPKIPIQIA
jgi:hypothetical protein